MTENDPMPLAEARVWYHGGARGLTPGGYVLPPDETGAPSTASFGAGGVCRTDRVYVTSVREAAIMFACLFPIGGFGWVYEVVPEGEREEDPDCDTPGMSMQCERARIVRRVPVSSWEMARFRHAATAPEFPLSKAARAKLEASR